MCLIKNTNHKKLVIDIWYGKATRAKALRSLRSSQQPGEVACEQKNTNHKKFVIGIWQGRRDSGESPA